MNIFYKSPPISVQFSVVRFTVNSQQLTINNQQSTVNSQQSTVNSQQSTINNQQSTVKNSGGVQPELNSIINDRSSGF
ncbi:hypothetical protein QT970_21655 [Microcoleus sp. herbarium8]|uniref:hypothetical protein n=1 Tax=Microcoleus sp. herbarium8 TaxID=3055436 RepID=UPI002FD68993